MLIESTAHLPISLAMFQEVFHAPDGAAIGRMILRWSHFVAGITWIGLLYFFNLVNVPFQKGIDADTKKKVNPDLLGRALWYFRWGALITVLVGLTYYAMYILAVDVRNANTLGRGEHVGVLYILLFWLGYPLVLFAIEFLIIKKVPGVIKDGRIFAVVMFVLVAIFTYGLVRFFSSAMTVGGESFASNKAYSIGIGGMYGIVMLLNVWGIIWPNNKRILAGLAGGPAAAPELARQAFIASRTNTWLSLPMLFFMATSHGDWIIFGR